MKLVQQPRGSYCCGSAAVAMVAGVPLDSAIQAVGTRGRSSAAQLKRGLARLGVATGDVQALVSPGWVPWVPTVVARIRWRAPRKRGHWVVIHQGQVYDPAVRRPTPLLAYCTALLLSGRFTLFFTVEG
jgi:hypothetical protein